MASVVLMAVPTVLIDLLPTQAQIGALAGAALVLLWLLQGLAAAGEFTSSGTHAAKQAHTRHRGRGQASSPNANSRRSRKRCGRATIPACRRLD
jgi:hypothetical protein